MNILRKALLGVTLSCASHAAMAFGLPEGMAQTATREDITTGQSFPVGPYADGTTETITAQGRAVRSAYRLQSAELSAGELLTALITEVQSDGYDVLYSCTEPDCGGFDFRYNLNLLPEPDMHVDLSAFGYMVARNREGHVASFVASRAPGTTFLHVTTVVPRDAAPLDLAPTEETEIVVPTGDLADSLATYGKAALDDLSFDAGSASLGQGPFASLAQLADWMSRTPDARIALVGHSDTTGALEGNVALSKRRAESVRARLIETYGVQSTRLVAQGVGFLSPRTSNATENGRMLNRRVEAVILSED